MTRRQPRKIADTFSTERPDPLELIARLLVSGGYRVPTEGTGSKRGLQASDIAGAVGLMRGALERKTVVAVATRAEAPELRSLAAAAYRRVMREVAAHAQAGHVPLLDLRAGADRYRLRLVVFDAAHELVHPERRRPYDVGAREAKMRKATYIRTHKLATSVLQQALDEGRQDFRRRLWGNS